MARIVKLQDIRLDGDTQFRENNDQNKVKEYAEDMDEGAVFPPLQCTFDGSKYWLWDGFHRYFAWQSLGAKTVEVVYTPGTREDAQDLALSANNAHGIPRTNETKRKQVEAALSMERHANKSDREIGKLCKVSHPFVAAIRNPEVKKQQIKNSVKHHEKLAESGNNSTPEALSSGNNSTLEDLPSGNNSTQDYGPDEAELKAMELSQQADQAIFVKMLESDDALKLAHAEITRLNYMVAQKEVRIASLMNEKNAVIKMVKDLEKQLKKATKK